MSDFKEGVVVVVDGTAKWARLTEESGPNEMSQKYQLDLYPTPESLKKLEEIMAQEIIKDKGEGDGAYITAKSTKLPRVYTADRMPFTGSIGNGSQVRAKVLVKEYEFKKKTGITAYLNGLVITKLEKYSGADDAELFQGLETPAAQDGADDLPF